MRTLLGLALSASFAVAGWWGQAAPAARPAAAETSPAAIGLPVGAQAPAFSLRDQSGRLQSNETLRGPRGTVLLFVRSADWCPYCKTQLADLQRAKGRFEAQGLKLAAISYDTVEIMKHFADRQKIEYPLLADPDSRVIRAFGVLNEEATGRDKGMARPGYFVIDASGKITEKFFEAAYQERYSANSVIGRLFPELAAGVPPRNIRAPYIQLAVAQSDATAAPGHRITLMAEVKLPKDVHVYAHGAENYRPTELVVQPAGEFKLESSSYPPSKMLYLPAIRETVPVYEGNFRITQEITISADREFSASLGAEGKTVTIGGEFKYQACDPRICYLPTSVPVSWEVRVLPLDRQRVPEAIQHK